MKKYLAFILLVLLLSSGCKTIYVSEAQLGYERIAEVEYPEDPEIKALIAPYNSQLSDIMDEEIGYLEVDMDKERPESNIGNWLADMFYEEAKDLNGGVLDFAVQNQGRH